MERYGLTFPQVDDNPGAVFERFGVPSQPALVVISPDGSVQRFLGKVDSATLDGVLADVTA